MGNQITEIKGLENLKNLNQLYLDENLIIEVKNIAGLESLYSITLRNNPLKTLGELLDVKLKSLMEVSISHTKVPKAEIMRIRKEYQEMRSFGIRIEE
jgi:protein phosphatase 1 regulatory subunit 7